MLFREPSLETDCELLWVKVNIVGCKTLYICAFYNPDKGDALSLKNFKGSLEWIRCETLHIWIAGDTNLPGLDWKYNCLLPNGHYLELARKFVDCLEDHGLAQLITKPTRGKKVLDFINKTLVIPGISDHDVVYVEGNISPITNDQKCILIPLYKKADWEGLREHMYKFVDYFVHSTECDSSVNVLWSLKFSRGIELQHQEFIPHKLTRARNGLPYVTPSLRHLIRKRDSFMHKKTLTTKPSSIPSKKSFALHTGSMWKISLLL